MKKTVMIVLAAVLLTLALPARSATAEIATTGSDLATPTKASAPQARSDNPLRCKYFADGDASSRYELCIKVLYRAAQEDKLVFSGFVENPDSRGRLQASCVSKTVDTFRWGGKVSATVEGSAWIFAKVSLSVEASFDKTRTTEKSISASFSVPPKSTKYCYYVERHEQYMTKQCFQNTYSNGRQCRRVMFYAPQREGWVVTTDPVRY